MKTENLQQLARDALQYASKKGASDCALHLGTAHGLSIQARQQSVENIQLHDQHSASITVYIGHKTGSSSVNQLHVDDLQAAVDRAYVQASFAEEDDCAGVAEEQFLAQQRRVLDLHHPHEIDQQKAIDMVLQAEQAAFDHDNRIANSEGASFDSEDVTSCLATSQGFNQIDSETEFSLSCAVVARDEKTQQVDYWYQRSRAIDKLGSPAEIGSKAAQRALAKLGSQAISTGKYPVLFVPDIAKGYWSSLISAIRGSSIYRKSSFLVDAMGDELFPKWLNIQEQPHVPGGFGSSDYDSEGVSTQKKTIIEKGALQTWLLGSYSARKLGLQTTGNAGGIGNITLSGTTHSFEQLCAMLGTGLIVTDTMGHGANMVTGDYSVGAQGLWVEQGQIQHAVEEITIASNMREMYAGLVAIGDDIDRRGSILSGSVLIEQMTVGGQ